MIHTRFKLGLEWAKADDKYKEKYYNFEKHYTGLKEEIDALILEDDPKTLKRIKANDRKFINSEITRLRAGLGGRELGGQELEGE